MDSPDVALIVNAVRSVNENVSDIREDMRVLRRDVNEKIDQVIDRLTRHEEKDAEYWKRSDRWEGQLLLVKGLTFSSFGLWIWQHFKDALTGK